MAPPWPKSFRPSRQRLLTAKRGWFFAVLLAGATATIGIARARNDPPKFLRERFVEGRLSTTTTWRPCIVTDSVLIVPPVRCSPVLVAGTAAFDRFARLTSDVRRAATLDSTTDGRHRRALVGLRWSLETPEVLDRAIEQLDSVRSADPKSPSVLSDLAVAQIAKAERDQSLLPLLRALEDVQSALDNDSTYAPALFDRAVVMERLSLLASGRRAWELYAKVDRAGAWHSEAAARAGALERSIAGEAGHPIPPACTDSTVADAARAAPHHTRELGMCALGAWGNAVLRGDSESAGSIVRIAMTSLSGDAPHRDSSTGPAFRDATRSDLSPARRRAYAEAYSELAEGQRLSFAAKWDVALDPLARARRDLAALGSPLAAWATLYAGTARVNLGFYDEADTILASVAADSTAEPELVSRAILALGVGQVRRSHFEQANKLYAMADPFLAKVPDRETVGYGAYLRAEGLNRAGLERASQDAALRALSVLAPLRRSNYLNNELTEVAEVARTAGLARAALVIMNEVLEVAAGVAKPETIALAYVRRARDQYAAGQARAGESDLDSAAAWGQRMLSGRGFERIRAFIQLTTGELRRPSSPQAVQPMLDSAVETFRKFDEDIYLPSALYESALAAEAAGDRVTARARLNEAVRSVERMQSAFRGSGGRAVFAERVERISDRIIDLSLEDGQDIDAFIYMERARSALLPALANEMSTSRDVTVPRLMAALSPREVFAEYALLDQRVIVWTLSRGRIHTHVIPVRRDSVVGLIARLGNEVHSAAPPDSSSATARLFDLLIRPIESEIRGATRLIIVPDRELFTVPYAALWNSRKRRYLVSDAEVRTVPGAAFLLSAARRHRAAGANLHALIVGDPLLSAADAATLRPLPGAAAEARSVAALYRLPTVLPASDAKVSRVVAELSRASILHFAGHAVFDPDRPDLSYLALAAAWTDSEGGRLRAREIDRLRLSNTSIVVLSACSTLNPRPTRAGAAAGLAYSFLNAGVPTIISTLWDVSDIGTTDFLVDLHRGLALGHDPGSALRDAQLRAINSTNPLLRAPVTWGAFTLTGY